MDVSSSSHMLVGGLEHFLRISIQLGIFSSQLTFAPSFFRGVGQPPGNFMGY
jgi:hypothetical protein